ncbi:MAG: CoA pyrophosphatase [Halobacteriaceae archaeon]
MDLSRVAAHESTTRSGATRDAAVLVPVVRRDGGDALLFTKRADHLGEHAGEMSFPGGGREPEDGDLRATALREAEEEIGLRPTEASVVGTLDDIYTVTDYAVRPFVGTIPDRRYTPHENEVAEIAVIDVADLLDPANYEADERVHPEYGEVHIDYFHVGDYTVWGATGRILAQLLGVAAGWSRPTGATREGDA